MVSFESVHQLIELSSVKYTTIFGNESCIFLIKYLCNMKVVHTKAKCGGSKGCHLTDFYIVCKAA